MATTTNTDINYQGGPFGGRGGRATEKGAGRGADEVEGKDSFRDRENGADEDASRRGRAVVRLQSLPNGEYPIRNGVELKAAIREWQKGPKSEVYSGMEIQRHIIKRARDLKMVALLPTEWGVNMEVLIDDGVLWMDKTADELEAESRNFSATQRRKYASSGVALKDGSFPIPDKDALRRAIRLAGKGKNPAAAKRHIIKRARALGATSMLPKEWSVTAEEKIEKTEELVQEAEFKSFLVAEGKIVPKISIVQEASDDNNQTMRLKVPFYIGESVNTPPGFAKKVVFPSAILQETVRMGKEDVAAKTQPLTVYARHAHAADANNLPIGAVTDLEQEGSIGYAYLDIEPTTIGKDVQVLVRSGKLNAVSLRSGPGKFELENVKVNGEPMLRMKSLRLSGIDFAPDKPAMSTYGIEVLQENAEITSITKEEKSTKLENLTLEDVKAKYPDIVSKIEDPFVNRLDEEVEKNKRQGARIVELEAKIAVFEIAELAREIASKHSKPEDALPVLMELAKECKTKEEFAGKALPILMEALSGKSKVLETPKETAEDKLRKLFGAGSSNGRGQTRETTEEIVQEEEHELKGEHVGPLEVPS